MKNAAGQGGQGDIYTAEINLCAWPSHGLRVYGFALPTFPPDTAQQAAHKGRTLVWVLVVPTTGGESKNNPKYSAGYPTLK